MSREDFENVLINQYTEVIDELVVESESVYRSHLDHDQLNQRIQNLIKAAKVDGLDESVIWKIVERRVPQFFESIQNTSNKVRHLKLVA